MFFLKRPTDDETTSIMRGLERENFSYERVGDTRDLQPHVALKGYAIESHRLHLGTGHAVYRSGIEAFRQWEMYATGWAQTYPVGAPLEPNQIVMTLASHFGIWSLNPCRIIYTFDEEGAVEKRFGFAFGTLHGHSESGEERFSIEWNTGTNEVSYRLLSFAKPQHPLVWMGYLMMRVLQKQFARDSQQAMRKAVRANLSTAASAERF